MNLSIFEFQHYKTYLNAWLRSQPKRGRGKRSELARAARCHTAYVSQVLAGRAHFSLEQAELLSRFLGLARAEAQYLLLLVQHARAGSAGLRELLDEQIRKALEKRLSLKERLGIRTMSEKEQPVYFGSWHFAAIHCALTVERLTTRDAISRYLDIPAARVGEVLDVLVSMGIAQEKSGRYEVGPTRIHLGHDSLMIARHHSNWRLQAMLAFERAGPSDQHYSSVVSLSRADALRLKKELLAAIEKAKAIVKDSPGEELYCFSLDLFGLARGGE
jgi:uncharacterized protein (TIGR02147 family)